MENLEPVEYEVVEDDESKNSRTLYYRPMLSIPKKMFNPEQWSLNNFQIGKHLGRGK